MNPELKADRARAVAVACPLTACGAPSGQLCISFVTGRPLQHLAAHDARLKAAGVVHPPLDAAELRDDTRRRGNW